MIVGANVAQPSERCRMTLKNGYRCRYPSKYNGLCGLHWQALKPNRPKLTRREWLQMTANVAQVIGTGILIDDHLRPKPPVTSIARVVDLSVRMTGTSTMIANATVTASGTETAQPAPLESASFAPMASAPIEVRRAVWQMHIHPKRLAEVPAGRLRWNQLRFPKAPEKWAI
jgi:hypothetical protein